MKVKRCGISKKRSRLNLIREGARKAMQNKRRVELRLLRRCAGANAAKFIRRADAPREPNRSQGCGRVCGARHVRRYALLISDRAPSFRCLPNAAQNALSRVKILRLAAAWMRIIKSRAAPKSAPCRIQKLRAAINKDLRRTSGYVSRKSR